MPSLFVDHHHIKILCNWTFHWTQQRKVLTSVQAKQLFIFCTLTGLHNMVHFLCLFNGPHRSSNCSITLTKFIKNLNFFCTEFKSGWQIVRSLPELSCHIFSQITTDLLEAENSIITLIWKFLNWHVH